MPNCLNKGKVPDCIVIDDDGESEVENEDSQSGAKVYSSNFYSSCAQHCSDDSNRAPPRLLINSSDEEDCVVMEPYARRPPSSSNMGVPNTKKRPKHSTHHRFNSKRKSGRPSKSSESDVIIDINGTVRRDWEEAALRKRMGNMFNSSSYRAESEESASVSSHANNDGRQSFISRQTGGSQHSKFLEHPSDQSIALAGAGSSHGNEGEDFQSVYGQQESNPDVLDARSGDATDLPMAPRVPIAGANPTCGREKKDECAVPDLQDSNPGVSGPRLDDSVEETSIPETVPIMACHDVLIMANHDEGEDAHVVSELHDSNTGVSGAQLDDTVEKTSFTETLPILARYNVPLMTSHGDREGGRVVSDLHDPNPCVSGARLSDTAEETFLAETVSIMASHDVKPFANVVKTDADGDVLMESSEQLEADVRASQSLDDPHLGNMQETEVAANPVDGDSIVNSRERLKGTEEFRQAVAEEWARRQLELQKQAQEAIRERKRRKVEAERRSDMEARQKQRLEEIRQSQLKEEQTSDLKEQVRAQIHSKLERVAATCRDMATLLRRLGISVDGGNFPTTQQVNAAYKKALLRFHPDRIVALVKRDPSHQVEAEETFKLISRMKSILPPVATSFF